MGPGEPEKPYSSDLDKTLKPDGGPADRSHVNTIAATTSRIPRTGLIALIALVAAFALLMVVRLPSRDGGDCSRHTSILPLTLRG